MSAADELDELAKAPAPSEIAPDRSTPYLSSIGTALSAEASGLRDPIEGLAQLASHALPAGAVTAVNKANNWLREKGVPLAHLPESGDVTLDSYEKQRDARLKSEGLDTGFRTMGRVMAPTNYVVPAGAAASTAGKIGAAALAGKIGAAALAGKIGAAALAGGASGAAEPVTGDSFWDEKLSQVEKGAATALGALGLGHIVSSAIAPKLRDAVTTLANNDVVMTAGQMIGGLAKRGEEAAKSVPVLGSLIRSAEGRGIASFNRATVNKALEPIGDRLPDDVDVGHDAIKYAQDAASKAYKDVLPHLTWRPDAGFANDLADIQRSLGDLPGEYAKQFENIIKNRVGPLVTPTEYAGAAINEGQRAFPSAGGASVPTEGTSFLTGEQFKRAESALSNLSSELRGSSVAGERLLGQHLSDVNTAMRDALERQNPNHAGVLQAANNTYAMLARVENAAARRSTSTGIFTPGDLLQASKSADRSARKRAFAAGDALLQDWAESAHSVLGNKLPDSGTTERMLWDVGGGGGLAAIAHSNPAGAGAGLAAMAAYTSLGQRVVQQALLAAPAARAAIAAPAQAVVQGLGAPLAAGLSGGGAPPQPSENP
jgi:hypothetical protein